MASFSEAPEFALTEATYDSWKDKVLDECAEWTGCDRSCLLELAEDKVDRVVRDNLENYEAAPWMID